MVRTKYGEMPLLLQADQKEEEGQWEMAAYLRMKYLGKISEEIIFKNHRIYFSIWNNQQTIYISVQELNYANDNIKNDYWYHSNCYVPGKTPNYIWRHQEQRLQQPPIEIQHLIEEMVRENLFSRTNYES